MKIAANGLLALGAGIATLCATALPAAAESWTPPGVTMGSPLGANPPAGLYFANISYYGVTAKSPTTSVGDETPLFIWVPGWTFLGASYAALALEPLVEVGVHDVTYLRGTFNPYVQPVSLSWNLGNGLFFSIGEGAYIPIKNSDVTFTTPGATSGAAFEQHASLSYLANDWVISANTFVGITTPDSAGVVQPDYLNIDLTLARNFGKWEVGVVGFGAWDLNSTAANAVTPLNTILGHAGRGEEIGGGGLIGYNFGVVDLQLKLTHQFVTHGYSNNGPDETVVWSTLVIPIWNPTPPPPSPVVAKY